MRSSEHNEQCTIIEWRDTFESRIPELHWLMGIPNGAKLPYRRVKKGTKVLTVSPERMRLLKEGMLPGASDLFLPVARKGFHGLWIELKVAGNKPTDTQTEFIRGMLEQGYQAMICYGAREAVKEISNYLDISPEFGLF